MQSEYKCILLDLLLTVMSTYIPLLHNFLALLKNTVHRPSSREGQSNVNSDCYHLTDSCAVSSV
jgi:hypothetical protein